MNILKEKRKVLVVLTAFFAAVFNLHYKFYQTLGLAKNSNDLGKNMGACDPYFFLIIPAFPTFGPTNSPYAG